MKTILAALLHDIGKFYQRTGTKLDNEFYENYTKNGGYRHACYTAKFIDENIKIMFDNIYDLKNEGASHHSAYGGIIQIADRIAAGHDRKDANRKNYIDDDNDEKGNCDFTDYKSVRLFSIFNEVKIHENVKLESKKMKLCTLNDLKFYEEKNEGSLEGEKEYLKLYKEFEKEVKQIYTYCDINNYEDLHNLLYPIIKKYTISIPANTVSDFPTVSLFEHLKLTAAIAGCLEKENLQESPMIIFDFDVSGIQSFIYRITEGGDSKDKISKSLRSRSFYLSLMADFVSYYIINKFSLSYENVLYSTSGRGRLLLPNVKNFHQVITNICNEIEQTLFELHHGLISMVFSYSEIDGTTLKNSSLSDFTDYDKKIFINKKTKKFELLLSSNDFSFISVPKKKICKMCNLEESDGEICQFCNKMIDLNDKVLSKTNQFIIEYDFLNKESSANYTFKVGKLGTINIYNDNMIKKLGNSSYYLSINCDKLGETKTYAMSLNKNISFTDIMKIKKSDYGDDKLSVIKMDVDNLGYIFLKGLNGESINNPSKDKNTISKSLNLSRSLDLFFTSQLPNICGNHVYINYAGGDDLVVVAPAWESLELIEKINKEFKAWTGNNDSFNISAGIDIFEYNSPVRYAIIRAENALDKAKQEENKNSFTVLGETLNNKYLYEINKEIEKFEQAILTNKLSRGGIYNIYSALAMSLEYEEENDVVERYVRFIPTIAYDIHRNIDNNEWKQKLKSLFVGKLTYNNIKKYKVVLGFALMNTREETSNV